MVFLRAVHKGRWSLFIMESWCLHRIQWGELNIFILCRCAARQSWPVYSLNNASASLRGDQHEAGLFQDVKNKLKITNYMIVNYSQYEYVHVSSV